MDLSKYQALAMRTAGGTERTEKQLLLWSLALMGEVGEFLGLVIRGYGATEDEDERLMLAAAFLGYYTGALCDSLKKRIGHAHDIPNSELHDILDKAWKAQEQVYNAIDGRQVAFPAPPTFRQPPMPDEIVDEISDIGWYWAAIAYIAGLDLDDVAEYNLEKLRERYGLAFSVEKSRNRTR